MFGTIILASASLSAASPAPTTDFGVRVLGVPYAPARATESAIATLASRPGGLSLSGAAALGAHWGRVTSTYRSPEHNRLVGGVHNSFHLLGRAIDVVPRPGVSHAMIAAAFRNAGYRIVESLDEGDHSHFAFSFGSSYVSSLKPLAHGATDTTQWRIVYAPPSGR